MAVGDAVVRVVVCGSVDDGKSTLLGRLLVGTASMPTDQIDATRSVSRHGHDDGADPLDYSLLTDGLADEREQGITIDIAYRSITVPGGVRLAIADAPGHEQYTRNMAVAASTADAALLLVDAERGVRTQTHRHLMICALMGVRDVIVAINKMDSLGFDSHRYQAIADSAESAAAQHPFASVTVLPTSALHGDNVLEASPRLVWWNGSTVWEALASLRSHRGSEQALRLPVQSILRGEGVRAVAGTIATGTLSVGDSVRVAGRHGQAVVTRFLSPTQPRHTQEVGTAVCCELQPEIDVVRGDLLVAGDDPITPADRFSADLIWMGHSDLAPGRSYELVCGPRRLVATVTALRHRRDVVTGAEVAARVLHLNDIGRVELALDQPAVLDAYTMSRDTGGFLLVDRVTAETVAAGMTRFALRRSANVTHQDYTVTREARAELNGHRSRVVWLTGLSGAGKSTIANAVEQRLHAMGVRTVVLDGDNMRGGLTKDLGFTPEDRAENVRRVAEVGRLMVEAGLVTIVALVSPFTTDRRAARDLFDAGDFVEVWVDTPIDVCVARDPKGLYARAADGELPNLTGVGQVYEQPSEPELVVFGDGDLRVSVDQIVSAVLSD